MKNNVSFSAIDSFIVLVETGSFTKAAEQLNSSRSHISKQLVKLEDSLGVRLMVRSTRSQHLTAQGKAFYQACKSAFTGLELAVDSAKESAEQLSGEIKINSVGGIIGERLIAPMVTDFMAQHADITVELDFSSRRVDLIQGEFDFVFRMGKLEDSELIAQKLADLNVGTYASPDYLAARGTPFSPKDLVEHQCITGSMRTWRFSHVNGNCTEEVRIDGALRCKNGQVMLQAALSNCGIIRVPELYCRDKLKVGQLVDVFKDWQVEKTPFYLVYVKDKYQAARVTAFKQYVLQHFAEYLAKV